MSYASGFAIERIAATMLASARKKRRQIRARKGTRSLAYHVASAEVNASKAMKDAADSVTPGLCASPEEGEEEEAGAAEPAEGGAAA
ncbi:unnamed protein product [Discula destructiva]